GDRSALQRPVDRRAAPLAGRVVDRHEAHLVERPRLALVAAADELPLRLERLNALGIADERDRIVAHADERERHQDASPSSSSAFATTPIGSLWSARVADSSPSSERRAS